MGWLVVIIGYAGGVWTGRSWPSLTRGEDQLGESVRGGLTQKDVAAGPLKQSGDDLAGQTWAVLTIDALVADAAGNLYPGLTGDLTQNLVEAGVVGSDGKLASGVIDLRAFCGGLRGCGRRQCSADGGNWLLGIGYRHRGEDRGLGERGLTYQQKQDDAATN
jgi:hypothetical protein